MPWKIQTGLSGKSCRHCHCSKDSWLGVRNKSTSLTLFCWRRGSHKSKFQCFALRKPLPAFDNRTRNPTNLHSSRPAATLLGTVRFPPQCLSVPTTLRVASSRATRKTQLCVTVTHPLRSKARTITGEHPLSGNYTAKSDHMPVYLLPALPAPGLPSRETQSTGGW